MVDWCGEWLINVERLIDDESVVSWMFKHYRHGEQWLDMMVINAGLWALGWSVGNTGLRPMKYTIVHQRLTNSFMAGC